MRAPPSDDFRTAETARRSVNQPVFIVWTRFQRRVASMDQILGFDVRYLPPPFERKWLKPLGYLLQCARTAGVLLRARPDAVWVQSPPTFLPHLALAVRPFAGGYRIIVDCHHRVFEAPWSQVPGTVRAMNRCDAVVVHNAESRAVAEAAGVRPELIRVLEDPPPTFELADASDALAEAGPAATGAVLEADPGTTGATQPYVLAPCSFLPDEPIPILLAAARRAPELRFMITGSRRRAEARGFVRDCPQNVTFTDYLPLADFERLLLGASAVLGLTDTEGVQLSVANEALGAHRALVLSDTRILRAMFGEAALFARNTPEDLAARLREAVARRPELEARSAALRSRRLRGWRTAVAAAALG